MANLQNLTWTLHDASHGYVISAFLTYADCHAAYKREAWIGGQPPIMQGEGFVISPDDIAGGLAVVQLFIREQRELRSGEMAA